MIEELANLYHGETLILRHMEEIRKEAALQRTLRALKKQPSKDNPGFAARLLLKLQEMWLITMSRVDAYPAQ